VSILQLSDLPEFTVGATYTIPRRTLTVSKETVLVTIDRVRRGSNDWIVTMSVNDNLGRYPHWRVMTQGQLRARIAEAARAQMPAAA
jgi:hypothetical protein